MRLSSVAVTRKVIVYFGALFLMGCALVSPAYAQDKPKFEGYGGYSVLRPNLPNTVDGQDTSLLQSIVGNMMGWNGGVTANVTDKFGITADISGYYRKFKDESGNLTGDTLEADAKVYTFLFGPRISSAHEKVRPFAHALFGFGKLSGSATVGTDKDSFSNTGLAMAFGGGVDVVVSEKVSIRPISLDFFPVRQKDEDINQGQSITLKNFRFGTSIVFSLGQ